MHTVEPRDGGAHLCPCLPSWLLGNLKVAHFLAAITCLSGLQNENTAITLSDVEQEQREQQCTFIMLRDMELFHSTLIVSWHYV